MQNSALQDQKVDKLVKSRKAPVVVIPAKAGIHTIDLQCDYPYLLS